MKALVIVLWLTACTRPNPIPARPAPIELTWVVYPVDPALKNEQDLPLVPLDLLVGGQRLKLEPQMGALNATYQGVCHEPDKDYAYPMKADEVARITFVEGSAGGYLVKRVGDKLILFTWGQSDGLCEDPKTKQAIECPVHLEQQRVLDVPATATVTQKLLVVGAAGTQAPIDCSKPYARDMPSDDAEASP